MKYVGKKPKNIGCITLSFSVSHCTFALILRLFCVLVQARFQTAVNVQHSTVRQTIYLFADQYPQPDNSRLTIQS